MAKNIRVNPEQMRARASQMRSQAEKLSQSVVQMDRLLSLLRSEWEGAASDVFAAKYHEIKVHFLKMGDEIHECADNLEKHATFFEELDASLA